MAICKIPACRKKGTNECLGCGQHVCRWHTAVDCNRDWQKGDTQYGVCNKCKNDGSAKGKRPPNQRGERRWTQ